MLLTCHSVLRKLYTEPSIDASYKVLVHLAKWFQRRRLKCEKLTDDRRRTTDANSSHCLWQSELKKLELQTNFGGPCRLGATSTISSWGGTRSNCIGVLDKKESFDVDVLGACDDPTLGELLNKNIKKNR